MSKPKVLVFDIERVPMRTKPLEAWSMKDLQYRRLRPEDIDSWGRTICLAYQWLGERKVHFIAEWQEGGRAAFLQNAHDMLSQADLVVGHNSTSFDVPHLQGEFALEGLGEPEPFKQFDTLLTARKKFNFEANHLDTLTRRFGLRHKTDKYSSKVAFAAVDGDEKAQKRIQRYNEGDVRATTALYLYLRPWGSFNLGTFVDGADETPICPICTSTKLEKRGVRSSSLGRYQQYFCTYCRKWSKGKRLLSPTVEVR
jgi:hypothetical protein